MAIAGAKERALLLQQDIDNIVKTGGTFQIKKSDRWGRFSRYVGRNKRKAALATGALIATAVVTGGLSLVVAVGALVVNFTAGTAWKRYSLSRKRGEYESLKQNMSITKKVQQKVQTATGPKYVQVEYINTEYGRLLLDDVRYLLKHDGLTEISNAFANLDNDFERIKVWAPHLRDVFGDGSVEGMGATATTERITKKENEDTVKRLTSAIAVIKNCDDAATIWETTSRLNHRLHGIEESIVLLLEFVTYSTLAISRFTGDSRTRLRTAWISLHSKCGNDSRRVLKTLNLAVNKQGLQTHFGRKLWSREVDYSAWIYMILPDYLREEGEMGAKFGYAVVERASLESFKGMSNAGVKAIREHAKNELDKHAKTALNDRNPLDMVARGAVSTGEDYLKDLSYTLSRYTGTAAGTGLSTGLAQSGVQVSTASSAAASPALAVANLVAGILAEIANSAWNEYQLKNNETLGITGFRKLTMSERLQLLRGAAKGQINAYVEMIAEWESANSKLDEAQTADQLAAAILRFCKVEKEYYSSKVAQFTEEAMTTVGNVYKLIEEYTDWSEHVIENYLGYHRHAFCKDATCCYGSVANAIQTILMEKGRPQPTYPANLKQSAQVSPVHRIGGFDNVEAIKDIVDV